MQLNFAVHCVNKYLVEYIYKSLYHLYADKSNINNSIKPFS